MDDERKPQRRADGTLIAGTGALNPSGRPKLFKEYQQWLSDNAYEKAKTALLECLDDPDGKTRLAAVKEVCDRLFGRAPQVITGADGEPIAATIGVEIVAALRRLSGDGR